MGQIRFLIVFLIFLQACQGEKKPHFIADIPSPGNNPASVEGIELGRKLFGLKLSNGHSGPVSCNSCHKPDSGFSSYSMNLLNMKKRSIPSLYNLAYSPHFFWDGREKSLESVVIKPIPNHEEMNFSLKKMVNDLNKNPSFLKEFKSAFGTDSIYTALVSRALAQYIRSLKSEVQLNSETQSKGQILFEKYCATCHAGSHTSDFKMRVSVIANSGPDSGKFHLSRRKSDIYSFKTPSLAKIKLTRPYMHDGRYSDLKYVVEDYSRILEIVELKNTQNQKQLIKFLSTL